MWICAKCGTQAQKIEVCSGCACPMTPLVAPKPAHSFALYAYKDDGSKEEFCFGPFPSVLEADQWWAQHRREDRFHHVLFTETRIMETP
jgi:hypothetical protein